MINWLNASLLRKGLSENGNLDTTGVINRRNGFGSTVFGSRLVFEVMRRIIVI